jgi:Holliday junction resolvase
MRKSEGEKDIKDLIMKTLKDEGWLACNICQGIEAHRGIADVKATKNGRTIEIEVKTKTGRQSEHQKRYQVDLEEHGGTYLLINDIDKLVEWLELNGGMKREVTIAPERVIK